jgi:hydroxyacylglutathione hydrolase
MKLFFHFTVQGFSNTYLIGGENGGDAILIDPGQMDIPLLKLIEGNNYYIRYVLVTHDHESHIRGIKTIKKIYDAQIVAGNEQIYDFPTIQVDEGSTLNLAGVDISCLKGKGHSGDSIMFKINHMLFTGDILGSGQIGTTPNPFAEALLVEDLQKRLSALPETMLVFPGHGPPSTVRLEKHFNPALDIILQEPSTRF